MPTLDWIGKRAVLRHHRDIPFHLLTIDPALSAGEAGSDNLLLEGDNLIALKALLPRYSGQVKCVYIDPPYNTGVDERTDDGKRAGWVYDDNVNSPEVRDWLHKVVGAEAEDLSRHDKWLCMMYPRIAILRDFLRNDGILFASIDDGEVANLRLLLDEIFGYNNHVGTIIWKNVTDNNPTNIATEHEYVVCYARDKSKLPTEWKSQSLGIKTLLLTKGDEFVRVFADPHERQAAYTRWFREHRDEMWPFDRYKYIDDGGIYTGSQSVHNPGKEGYRYDVIHPGTGKPCTQPLMGYRFPEETMRGLIRDGRILFGEDETKIIELKVYVKEYRAKLSSIFELDGRIGTNELKVIFPKITRPFDFPKPTDLISELLSFTTSGDDLVLDSFAGSGTTGHAVLKLNAQDGQHRRFILVERKAAIAREITAPRLARVIAGFVDGKGNRVEGLGSGFQYAKLGPPILDDDGGIRDGITFEDLAASVYHAESGASLVPGEVVAPLLGVHRGTAIYLLYNERHGDLQGNGNSVLTLSALRALPEHRGPKIVYAEGCRLSESRLASENVVFKQIPYGIVGR